MRRRTKRRRSTRFVLLVAAFGCSGKRAAPKSSPAAAHADDSGQTTTDTGLETGPDTGPATDTAPATAGDSGGSSPTGPCTEWGAAEAVGEVADPSLEEISGIVASALNPGVLWVIEDSGADPVVTALDTTGQTLGKVTLEGVGNRDYEDLAGGPCGESTCLFVGEFGDNGESRTDVAIYRFEEPVLTGTPDFALTATPDVFAYGYPEGPQNAEGLIVTPAGDPVVFTKRSDATTRLYRVPLVPDTVSEAVLLTTLTTAEVEGTASSATAADLWPDGSRLLVRTYLTVFELDLGDGGIASAEAAIPTHVTAALERQGEAIAYDPTARAIWHVSEGVQPALYRIGCLD
jgi:hypothetical protein